MATIAELMIRLGVETKDVRKDAQKAVPEAEAAGKKAGEKFASGFGSAARALKGILATAMAAVSIGAVAHGVMDVTKTASDLNETTSKSSVLFGSAAEEVQKFAANAATALGQSKQAALDGASTFAVYGRGAGLAGSKLVGFSTNLVTLASDMASFANTSPQEAIEAIGSALRGEMDPIEKYGVLLNEATLKQTALRLGLIKTTSAALTPQQKVLAVNAALMEQLGKKGTDTIGDFARTSAGLANQQRILVANMTNLRAEVGQALLPVMTDLTSTLNTQLMPALNELWATHGQQITAMLQNLASKAGPAFGTLVDKITSVDWPGVLERAQSALAQIGPQLQTLQGHAGPLNDTIKVGGVVFGFLADHLDLVGKALPWLIGGYLAVKAAQGAANAMQVASMPLRLLELATTWKQNAALRAHTVALRMNAAAQRTSTAAQVADTAAANVGILAKGRAVVANMAMRVAELAKAAATGIATAAQWLLNIAMAPITLIIIGIVLAVGLLVAGILWLWRNNEGFRNFVLGAWAAIQAAFKAVVDWIVDVAVPFVAKWFKMWWEGAKQTWEFVSTWFGRILSYVTSIPGKITGAASGMFDGIVASAKGSLNKVIGLWNSVDIGLSIGPIPDWVPGVGGKRFSIPDLFPDIPQLAHGAFVPATPGGILANIGEGAHGEVVETEPKMRAWIREAVAAAGGGGGDGDGWIAEVRAKDGADQWLADFVEVRIVRKLSKTARRILGGPR